MIIDRRKRYSMSEILTLKISGLGTLPQVKQAVMRGSLKADVLGSGRASRFYILGSDLIKFSKKN